jgi:hypothetical protein
VAAAAVVALFAVVVLPREEPARFEGRPVTFAVAPAGVTASAEVRDWGWR